MKRQFSILLHIFVLLALSGCGLTTPSPSPMPTPTATPKPSGMVAVGGYALYYECSGQGSSTVILESGGTGDSSDWAAVIDGLEGTTRVCAYDRASLGRSDPVTGPRTFEEMIRDLQVLLDKAHIGGPYILVGWPMGGMLVRIFADQHPGEVAGVVLLDSAHPDMGLRLLACLPTELAGEPENIQYLRQYFIWMSDSNESPSFPIDKNVDIRPSMQQARLSVRWAISLLRCITLIMYTPPLSSRYCKTSACLVRHLQQDFDTGAHISDICFSVKVLTELYLLHLPQFAYRRIIIWGEV